MPTRLNPSPNPSPSPSPYPNPSPTPPGLLGLLATELGLASLLGLLGLLTPVSYTHLTLPTILRV